MADLSHFDPEMRALIERKMANLEAVISEHTGQSREQIRMVKWKGNRVFAYRPLEIVRTDGVPSFEAMAEHARISWGSA